MPLQLLAIRSIGSCNGDERHKLEARIHSMDQRLKSCCPQWAELVARRVRASESAFAGKMMSYRNIHV